LAINFTVWSHILSPVEDALGSPSQRAGFFPPYRGHYVLLTQHWVPVMAPSELKGEPSRAGHNWHLVLAAWHNGLCGRGGTLERTLSFEEASPLVKARLEIDDACMRPLQCHCKKQAKPKEYLWSPLLSKPC